MTGALRKSDTLEDTSFSLQSVTLKLSKSGKIVNEQKQSSRGVLWKRCSYNFRKIHSKTPVTSLFINFIKRETLAQVVSCEFCEIYKNNFSYRTPLVAASKWSDTKYNFQKM